MAYDTKDIVKSVPPPDKLGKAPAAMGAETPDEEADEDKAARIGAMQEFLSAIGVKADTQQAEDACEALERYMAAPGR